MFLGTQPSSAHPRPHLGNELSVETVPDFTSFVALRSVWDRLVEESGINHPFLSHEWLCAWWQSFHRNQQLHIVLVKDRGVVVAIAPLMVRRIWLYGVPVRSLEFIYNVHTPRCDFIIARRAHESDVYDALWTYLTSRKDLWDMARLCQIPAGSPTLQELPRLATRDQFLAEIWRSADSPFVRVRGSWDRYVQSLPAKYRQNIRRRMKRLQEQGTVDVEVITGGQKLEAALEDGFRIEQAAWKGQAGTAILSRPELRRFYTQVAESAAEKGWLRLCFLTLDGRRIAFAYFLVYGNTYYLLKPGYDPQYAQFSPSHLLCFLVFPEAFAGKFDGVDLLGAADEWKKNWTPDSTSHYWLYIFRDISALRWVSWLKFRLVPRLQRRSSYQRLRDWVARLSKPLSTSEV